MVLTYKQKFNKKYGFEKDKSHSISDISKITGYKIGGLKDGVLRKEVEHIFPILNQLEKLLKVQSNGRWLEYMLQ